MWVEAFSFTVSSPRSLPKHNHSCAVAANDNQHFVNAIFKTRLRQLF